MFETRKLMSYRTSQYHQYLPYRCLGRYRNALVLFQFKYRLYRSRFRHIEINIGFWPENRYRAKQKNLENPPNFKIHLLTLTSVFPHLLCICLCFAFLLLFLCFTGLCFYSPFIFFIYFSTRVYLFVLIWYTSLKVETRCAFGLRLKIKIISQSNLFLLLFMGPTHFLALFMAPLYYFN